MNIQINSPNRNQTVSQKDLPCLGVNSDGVLALLGRNPASRVVYCIHLDGVSKGHSFRTDMMSWTIASSSEVTLSQE